jgi:alkanesulfonate monooxygenase SsuD/methylene tetrahydromethanopterin reductase-like flavin-dependent oxidoreductase (luciferase family)
VKTYEAYTTARDWLQKLEWDMVVRGGAVVCGSPDQVAERIAEIHELCGITHYLAWTRIGGLAHQKVLRSMELMREKVMPQVRHLGQKEKTGVAVG